MLKNPSLVVVAVLTGCLSNVVALSPEGKKVTLVHETDRPLRCSVLGKISGQSRSTDGKEAITGAENDFRNQAAELQANFALVETERNNRVGTSDQRDVFLGGKALRCVTDEMEEQSEKAEAEARAKREQAETEDGKAQTATVEEKKAEK